MPDRDAQDEGNKAPATPRVSGEASDVQTSSSSPVIELVPGSATRATLIDAEPAPLPSARTDTLLSAGKPADPLELLLEDRLSDVDERLRELEGRILVLERKKPLQIEGGRTRPWLWIVFLVALAAVFQLLRLAQ